MGLIRKELGNRWNLFNRSVETSVPNSIGGHVGMAPRHWAPGFMDPRNFVNSIQAHLALDFASVKMWHAMVEDESVVSIRNDTTLHECLTLNPNIDQSAFAFRVDLAMTMFKVGHAAVVPIETDGDPDIGDGYKITDMRVGRILEFGSRKVRVSVWDDREEDANGNFVAGNTFRDVVVDKSRVAIIQNPFYEIMNQPNGSIQRLGRKIQLLDTSDEEVAGRKLDIIFQLPYSTRNESRKKRAEDRRTELAEHLAKDEYGIGYIDAQERVIQLNRPINSTLAGQIDELKNEVYTDLGVTPSIINGSADRDTVNNYFDRTIDPITTATTEEFTRKFLSRTAVKQGQRIVSYRDPLKIITISELAEVADKLKRNALVTSNEFRPKLGLLPSKDQSADVLTNPNMPIDDQIGGGGENIE